MGDRITFRLYPDSRAVANTRLDKFYPACPASGKYNGCKLYQDNLYRPDIDFWLWYLYHSQAPVVNSYKETGKCFVRPAAFYKTDRPGSGTNHFSMHHSFGDRIICFYHSPPDYLDAKRNT